jgi:nitroreductase
MDFIELVKNRESIRNYDPEKLVEKDKLERILEAGRLAPSAANRQPWRFYLISTPENLDKIRTCYSRSWFSDAPHVLIVAGKKEEAWTRGSDGYNALETDLTIAMDHMILAAEAEGVATCWIAAFDPDKLKQSGILEPDETVYAMTPLGYPKPGFVKTGNKIRKAADDVIVYK